jgi:hypothetical protein
MSKLITNNQPLEKALNEQKQLITSLNSTYDATKKTVSQALIIETYCQRVLLQTPVNFGGVDKLKDSETAINSSLAKAKENANFYMKVIQPNIIKTLVNVQTYCNLNKALGTAIGRADSIENVIKLIERPLQNAMQYKLDAENVVKQLQDFQSNVVKESETYQSILSTLESLVNSESDLMKSYENDLKEIEKQIAEMMALIAGGAIGIAAGSFMIAVGTIAGFVTAGTSVKLAGAGAVLVVSGVGAAVGGGIALANLLNRKSDIVREREKVKLEAKIAREYITAFTDLGEKAKATVQASQGMINGWQTLGTQMESLIKDLKDGSQDLFFAQHIYSSTINDTISNITSQTQIIHQQMAGVSVENVDLQGTTLSEVVRQKALQTV